MDKLIEEIKKIKETVFYETDEKGIRKEPQIPEKSLSISKQELIKLIQKYDKTN